MASNQLVWQSNDGDVPLLLEVQVSFTPVSGLSPTVEVKRCADEFYADWTTNTFKSPAASGDRFGSMTEVANTPGVYKRLFNPLTFSQTATQQCYLATYRVTIPSGTVVGSTTLSADQSITETEIHFFNNFNGSGVLGNMTAEFC